MFPQVLFKILKKYYILEYVITCLCFISRTCIRRWRRAIWPHMKWRQPRRVRGGTFRTESPPVEQMPSDSCCVPTTLKVCTYGNFKLYIKSDHIYYHQNSLNICTVINKFIRDFCFSENS